jgi:hypothetical protein
MKSAFTLDDDHNPLMEIDVNGINCRDLESGMRYTGFWASLANARPMAVLGGP